MRVRQGWVAVGGVTAVLGFFLPWVKTWLDFGPEMSSTSGYSFAKITESVSSGNSLALLWIVLIAGALALVGAVYSGFVRLDSRSYRGVCGMQAVLAIAGIAIIWMTMPSEIDTWSGLVVEYQIGIWLATLGLAIAALAAIVGAAARRDMSPRPISMLVALVMVVGACSGGPFTIEEFRADSGCTAEGVMEVTASGQARAVGDIEYNMISAGMPSAWCVGLIHRLQDGAEISGYLFNSEPGAPLEFEVTADGYTYLSGTGSVTDPDGKVTTLP